MRKARKQPGSSKGHPRMSTLVRGKRDDEHTDKGKECRLGGSWPRDTMRDTIEFRERYISINTFL